MLDAAEGLPAGFDRRFQSAAAASSSSSPSSSSPPVSELRAATPEKAAFFLDAALANRTSQKQNTLSGQSLVFIVES